MIVLEDDGDLFIGDGIGQSGNLGGRCCGLGGHEIGGVDVKVEGLAKVVESIMAGDENAGLRSSEFLLSLVLCSGDLAFVVIGGSGVVRGVLGIDIAKFVADALDSLAPQLRAIPDMRIIELLAALSLFRPGQEILVIELIAHRELLVSQGLELVHHLGLEVEAIPEYEVGVLHSLNIVRGGLVGVRITAGADHSSDIGFGGEVGCSIGQVAGGGEDF